MWNSIRRSRVVCLAVVLIFSGLIFGCGDSGDDPPPKATITGTVAGTVVVVFDFNGSEIARQKATGNPKTFILTVPVDGNYRIYLLENEGTTNERVYSLFPETGQGIVNSFVISSATTIDLGFVDTSTGVAVPSNSPLGISGVSSGGLNLDIPLSLKASSFTSSDLKGDWDFHILTSGDFPQSRGWAHGEVSIGAGNTPAITSVTRSNVGSSFSPVSSFLISSSGVVTNLTEGEFHGIMNSRKDRITGVMTDAEGGYNLIVYSKKSVTTFSQSDLTGTWNFRSIVSGDAPQWVGWVYGQGNADAAGNLTFSSIEDSEGGTRHGSPGNKINLAVDTSGIVRQVGFPSFHGTMNSAKDSIVATLTDDDGGYTLMILEKVETAASFSLSDLEGPWNLQVLTSGDSPQWTGWVYGKIAIEGGTSNLTSLTRSDGVSSLPPTTTSSVAISSSGLVTISGNNFNGIMNSQKNRIIGVMTDGGGGYNMVVYSK